MRSRWWPLFDLVVRTPRVELRYPDDDLVTEITDLSMDPIHPPETMPFGHPWTDAPPALRGRGGVQHYWRGRAEWTPASWDCPFAVIVDGAVVGVQGLIGRDFPTLRTVSSGSWISMAHQGRGIGTEMRSAAVHFAFAGLGALRCESAAFEDNAASMGVSRRLGYVENGDQLHPRRGAPGRLIRLLLDRSAWHPRLDVEIEGLGPCLELFGAL